MTTTQITIISTLTHLIWGEVVQKLPDVVAVLTLPVVASPGDTVCPAVGTVCDQTLVNGLQHLHRLSPGKLQGAFHELWISGKRKLIIDPAT